MPSATGSVDLSARPGLCPSAATSEGEEESELDVAESSLISDSPISTLLISVRRPLSPGEVTQLFLTLPAPLCSFVLPQYPLAKDFATPTCEARFSQRQGYSETAELRFCGLRLSQRTPPVDLVDVAGINTSRGDHSCNPQKFVESPIMGDATLKHSTEVHRDFISQVPEYHRVRSLSIAQPPENLPNLAIGTSLSVSKRP